MEMGSSLCKKVTSMWIGFAAASALFAGLTAILAKCGVRHTSSSAATVVRTIAALCFAWGIAAVSSPLSALADIEIKTWAFLILSGLATGASWLAYFKALQLGPVNQVVPIDKSSIILTILMALVIFGEPVGTQTGIALLAIGAGTFLMIEKKKENSPEYHGRNWIGYAFGSAFFASLTSILGKAGMEGIDSNLGTAIRTVVVLFMALLLVFAEKKEKELLCIERKELVFLLLSGIASGASWLCYYRALQEGPASVVVPIDKLSILVTILFSYVVFKEKLTRKAAAGLVLLTGGTLLMTW